MLVPYISHLHWDSLLDTSQVSAQNNANLYLIVRTFLRRYDPPGGSGRYSRPGTHEDEPVVAWDTAQWETWRRDFKRMLEDGINGQGGWNNRFWLIPSRSWQPVPPGFVGDTYVAAVRCCLRIDLVDDESRAHLKLHVKRLAAGNIEAISALELAGLVDRSAQDYGYLDHRDLEPRPTLHGQSQIPVMHEFGHYLGLDHVAGRGNAHPNFGAWPTGGQPTPSQSHRIGDVMGCGMRLEPWHARPWKRRIAMHLDRAPASVGAVEWSVSTSRPMPNVVHVTPRTAPGGASLDAGITGRVSRDAGIPGGV